MGFSPKVETREQRSQATPLAEDILKMIQGQISSGTFGQGAGGMTQGAGTAIQQFVNSGGANATPVVRDVGPAGADFGKMIASLEAVHNRNVNQGAADLREGMGAAGTRYGTTLNTGEARFRGEAAQDFDVQAGNLAVAHDTARRADSALGVQRDVWAGQLGQTQQDQMLKAIMAMFDMGKSNESAGFELAGSGILPEHLITKPGMGGQLFSGLTSLLATLGPVLFEFLKNQGGAPGGTPGVAPGAIVGGGSPVV